jgi:phosphatidate cytidylyltransferase
VSSGLRQRLVTGLLLAALVIAILLLLPPAAALATVFAVVAAGAWEWAGFAGLESARARGAYVAGIALAVAAAWWATGSTVALQSFLAMTVTWWVAALAWLGLAPTAGGRRAAAASGFAVLVPAAVGVGRLVLLEPHGTPLLLFLLVLIAAADVGAYFGGRALGRRKLAPRVSPGKTWEGFVAGMIAALLAAAGGAALFDRPLLPWIAVCAVVALVSVVGDLAESMFKRRAGLKDSSALLPGHGGVLDRIDSLTAAGPVFLLGLHVIGFAG